MPVRKGSKKTFDTGVIATILTGTDQGRLDKKRPVNFGDVAEVNEYVLPISGRCMGLLVQLIAVKRTRPVIVRQLRKFPKFENFKLRKTSLVDLKKRAGSKITLVCTGR